MGLLYVHALTGRPVRSWKVGGRTIESVAVGPIFAVCERRATPPPLSEDELRRQHSIVMTIASRSSAVLPARFGALIDEEELTAVIRRREDVVRDALALVDGKVQMTVRAAAPVERAPKGRLEAGSGAEYLRQRLRDASPRLSAPIEAALKKIAPRVASERRETTAAGSVAVYHLVRPEDVDAYRDALKGVAGVAVSGPAPPFAFAPELQS